MRYDSIMPPARSKLMSWIAILISTFLAPNALGNGWWMSLVACDSEADRNGIFQIHINLPQGEINPALQEEVFRLIQNSDTQLLIVPLERVTVELRENQARCYFQGVATPEGNALTPHWRHLHTEEVCNDLVVSAKTVCVEGNPKAMPYSYGIVTRVSATLAKYPDHSRITQHRSHISQDPRPFSQVCAGGFERNGWYPPR